MRAAKRPRLKCTSYSRYVGAVAVLLATPVLAPPAWADSNPAHVAAASKKPLPWPDGVIPYDISKLSEGQQQTVLRAMQRWMDTGARITFIPRTNQVEYVNFTGNTDAGNNTSGDGFRPGARVDVNITSFWWRQGEWMPAHELGHVLGFHHEHQRWDRDNYVQIHYEHIKAGRESDYNWIPKTNWIVSSTSYDYYSIMHYRTCWASSCESECKDGDGSSPCAVIDPMGTQFDRVIGQWTDNGISPTDGEKLRLVYGKLASPEVTAAMQPYLDSYKLAGMIGIIADKTGKVHYKNLLGYADVEAKRPINEDNVFWIASMTKMFAGASIMMLADEGKVSLDDPVAKFIPQLSKWMVVEEKDTNHILLKPLIRPVTIRHVLSHTSGLTGSSELQQVTGSDSTPLKARALSSVTGPLQWQPGEKYQYGNQGMNIAARIVEIVSEMPYEAFLQKRFFDPLGMTETTFWPSEAQMARLAGTYGRSKEKNGYARGGVGFLTKPYSDRLHRFPEAGGGLFSTTHDVLRYGLMLANDGELDGKRYLSHAAMEELRKEQTGTTKINYSLGYHLRNGMFGHDGAYGTDLSVNPTNGMVAVFMVQCPGPDQWAARDLFLKTATQVFNSIAR